MRKSAKQKRQSRKEPLNLTMKMWHDSPYTHPIVSAKQYWWRPIWRWLNRPIKFSFGGIGGSGDSYRRLINLLHGDRAAAQRLINRTQAAYPGKSGKWINEKVIQDLINDRR